MNLFVVIIAHGAGIAAFRRHLPLWQAHKAEGGLVLVPENDPIEQSASPWPVTRMASAEHNGQESLVRLRWLLDYLSTLESFTHFVIYEYDSFCLAPTVATRNGFCGNVFANKYMKRFLAPRYANPPWTVDRDSLLLMLAASKRWSSLIEEGEADRYLSALAFLSNVPILEHDPKGFSRGWITENEISDMRKAIYGGSTMIHGIKQEWTLKAALQFYDERTIVSQ